MYTSDWYPATAYSSYENKIFLKSTCEFRRKNMQFEFRNEKDVVISEEIYRERVGILKGKNEIRRICTSKKSGN